MLIILKTLHKLLKLLNSETAPSQLSAGIAFGMIVGLSPFFAWHNLVIFLLVFLLRVNLSMFFMATAFFAIIGFFMDPLFDRLGYFLLVELDVARSLWIWIASAPILPFFRLNNTVVMGSLALSLITYFPVFVVAIWAIGQYRKHWKEKIKDSKFMKWFKATKLYGLYEKYQNFQEKWENLV